MAGDEVTVSVKSFKYLMNVSDSFTPFIRVERTEYEHQDDNVYSPWFYSWG